VSVKIIKKRRRIKQSNIDGTFQGSARSKALASSARTATSATSCAARMWTASPVNIASSSEDSAVRAMAFPREKVCGNYSLIWYFGNLFMKKALPPFN
jgi:hypothetical protein